MNQIPIRFVITQLSEEEIEGLKSNYKIVSKMILSSSDFELFRYHAGDRIEVESPDGYRIWCSIDDLDVLHHGDHIIIIFVLKQACKDVKNIALR